MHLTHDLHAHSTASDGTLSPSGLMRRAHANGVEVMALTDHDTLAGLEEAEGAAEGLGLSFVPGVEVSVTWSGRTVHIVGLGVDRTEPTLVGGLAGLREHRRWRAAEMGRSLAKRGIEGIHDLACELSSGGLISRTHFAHALVKRGYCEGVREVFKHYLVKGKPGFVEGKWASLADAVGWIRGAGGQAVIAHPARYNLTRTKLLALINEFILAGGEGIEVVSGSHSRDDYFTMAKHARDSGLLASAGSDFHGPEHAWLELGQLPALPHGCKPIWHNWAA